MCVYCCICIFDLFDCVYFDCLFRACRPIEADSNLGPVVRYAQGSQMRETASTSTHVQKHEICTTAVLYLKKKKNQTRTTNTRSLGLSVFSHIFNGLYCWMYHYCTAAVCTLIHAFVCPCFSRYVSHCCCICGNDNRNDLRNDLLNDAWNDQTSQRGWLLRSPHAGPPPPGTSAVPGAARVGAAFFFFCRARNQDIGGAAKIIFVPCWGPVGRGGRAWGRLCVQSYTIILYYTIYTLLIVFC